MNQPGFNVRAADIRGANVWGEVAGWLSIEQPDQVDAVALVDHAISGHLPGFRMGPSC